MVLHLNFNDSQTARRSSAAPRKTQPKLVRLGLLCAVLGAISLGCGGDFGDFLGVQSPDANYREFTVQSLSLEQAGFDLGFDLSNPNSFALPLVSLDWNLDVFERPFSFGQMYFDEAQPSDTEGINTNDDGGILTFFGAQSLPANGQLALNTPFNVAILDTFEGLTRIALGEDVPYTIGGTLHFQTRFGDIDVPFNFDGLWENGQLVDFLDGLTSDLFN